ncbi:hypothetical protein Poli38472_001384 [Pythium oligandrum]|uniref:Minichromosome loss protein Mcl1 middle region domain-containing protein n=1 Tax=Pythium oligandrum TaxID=41045 RepID=A0A8K1CUK0_PYTOL|nr:hypothetical protein Poli38472_001384 [Pythium oligandrum]|eukprot:TMW69228.1 hypothetical protein Poli38472_001384 [Pythium oligandrum]
MESMKQITVNSPGVGDMALFRAAKPLADDGTSVVGHDVVVTSGEDGVVYMVDLTTETVVFESVVWDGPIPSVAVTPEQSHLLIVSGDENVLYSYKMPPSFEMDQLLFRSPVAIRHVACSAKFIAIATEDTEIKVLRRAATDQMISVPGHDHGIKSVSFDQSGELLCSSSEDGTVRVFALDEAALSAKQVALFKVQYADVRSEEVLCRCGWQPGSTGSELLAVPVNQSMLELIDRSTWKSRGQLLLPIGKSQSSDINLVSFSPNGEYVLASTLKKELFVWSISTKEVVRSFRADYNVVSLAWAQAQNALVAFNDGGRVGFVKDVIPTGLTPPHQTGLGSTSAKSTDSVTKSASTAKPTKKRLSASQFVEDEAMDDGGNGEDDDEAEFDEGETRVEAIKASFGFGSAAAADLGLADDTLDDDDVASQHIHARPVSSGTGMSPYQTIQEPFQSGMVHDSSVSLLAWTPLGEIECIRGANRSENLVKVEFTDKSRRGFKFSDNYLFSMGVLDDHGAFFAVPRRAREDWDELPDQESGDIISSFIFYRPFDAWASNSSWHLDLPEGEDAACIAAAREFCVVATSLHCLRVFTTSGIPYALLRLPGRVVTMTARDSRLAVVYHDVFGRLEFQLLEIAINSEVERVRVLAQGRLPLTPPTVDVFASQKENEEARQDISQWSTLKWLGFDERGVLYSVDSFGCVQALARGYDWNWFPVGCVGNALSKKPEDRHAIFTLGIVNNSLLYFPLEPGMAAPKLRGKHRPVPLKFSLHTASFPKTRFTVASSSKKKDADAPSVNELWQQVRLASIDGTSMDDEDRRVQEHAEMDKSLILMMKAACTNDEPARVLDLAKCLYLEKSHQIAQKLAVHFGLRQLQTQLYDLYRDRFERYDDVGATQSTQFTQSRTSFRSQESYAEPAAPAPYRPKPRLGREPKPVASQEETQQEEVVESTSAPSTPPPKRDWLNGDNKTEKEQSVTKKPIVERSVAPTNPFLKKPSADGDKKKGGLERLANFTSPPPAKRTRPWK